MTSRANQEKIGWLLPGHELVDSVFETLFSIHFVADVTKTRNGERGTGNGERGTGNGSLGASCQRKPP